MDPLEITYETDGRVTLNLDLKVTIELKDTFELGYPGRGDGAELRSVEHGASYWVTNGEMTDRIRDALRGQTTSDDTIGWMVTDVQEVTW